MYVQENILNGNTGNNAFSYEQRKQLFGKAEITIPSLKEIIDIKNVKLGNHIVFEEIDHNGKLQSCTGLKYIYQYIPTKKTDALSEKEVNIAQGNGKSLEGFLPIYIFDNHNHALFFRGKHIQETHAKEIKIIHIDQHSDLSIPKNMPTPVCKTSLEALRPYTNHTCNVGNFIPPFLHLYPQTTFERIKSESQLLEYNSISRSSSPLISSPLGRGGRGLGGVGGEVLILDIDLDFRAPEMNSQYKQHTIDKTRDLIKKASLVTIATSPYFLNQEAALDLLDTLFTSPR